MTQPLPDHSSYFAPPVTRAPAGSWAGPQPVPTMPTAAYPTPLPPVGTPPGDPWMRPPNGPGPYAPPSAAPPQGNTGFCHRCGRPAAGMRFCPGCGQAIGMSGATSYQGWHTPPQPVRAPLRLSVLLPLGDWWRYGLWRDRRLLGFAAVALIPFLLLHISDAGGWFGFTALGFAIYFAVLWSLGIRMLVKPEKVSAGLLTSVVGITAVLGIALTMLLESHLGANPDSLLRSIATIGFPEELGKALPLLLVLWRLGPRGRPGTYLYLGVVSGLTFGALEAVGYSAAYTDQMDRGSDPSVVVGVIWRLLTDSLFHGAMAGITGLFVGLAALEVQRRWLLVGAGLTFAAVLHGAYDRFADSWGGL